jgi:hypothetical protein
MTIVDPETLKKIIEGLGGLGGGGVIFKSLRFLFRASPKDLEPCKLRIIRERFPWSRQMGIHLKKDGKIELKAIRDPSMK